MKEGKCKKENIGNNKKIDFEINERRKMQEIKNKKQ
jgi:hypothetical protein